MHRLTSILLVASFLGLAGCDMMGVESASAVAARREADSKAIGAGCRHAARSVEHCYALNKRADKAAVFAGWREMNDYMRENKIEAMPESDEVVVAAAGERGEAAPADSAKGEKADKAAKSDKASKTAPKPAIKQ